MTRPQDQNQGQGTEFHQSMSMKSHQSGSLPQDQATKFHQSQTSLESSSHSLETLYKACYLPNSLMLLTQIEAATCNLIVFHPAPLFPEIVILRLNIW